MRLLYVTPRPLWPGRRGDQVRTAGLLEGLRARHEVRLVSQRWPGFGHAPPPSGLSVSEIRISRGQLAARAAGAGVSTALGARQPLQAGLFDHDVFARRVLEEVEDFAPDLVILVLSRLGALVPRLAGVPVALDLIDALGANMRRRGHRQPSLAWLWRREARRLDAWDAALIEKVRLATVVAERDRTSLLDTPLLDPLGPASSRLEVVPFGLEVPAKPPERRSTGKVLALTGNLGYFPTVDAALWFGRGVWPELRRRHPDAEWLLAGSRPAKAVRELARSPGVRLVIEPPRLSDLLASSAVALAPLFAGSGTPIKILEAMALGVPVVTTPAGRAGLDDLPDEAAEVADGPADFADAIDRLLSDPDLAHRRSLAAWEWLRGRHHLPRVVERYEALLQRAIEA